MDNRTEVARRAVMVAGLVFTGTCIGCTSVPRQGTHITRDSSARANQASETRLAPVMLRANAPLPTLDNATVLAIQTPSRSPGASDADVKPASLQATGLQSTESDPVRRLYRDAAASYAKQGSYIARLRRREFAPGRQKPEEVLIFKFREQPYSVHFKWLGEEGKGREVVYVSGRDENKLHILTAAGDIPFTPAGRRLDLAADSILVRAASRYPITEAGLGSMIRRFGVLLDAVARQEPGLAVKYLGPMQRAEYATLLEVGSPGTELEFAL